MKLLFFPGLHQPGDAHNFRFACISINRLWTRKKPVRRCRVLLDSGAYTVLDKHGHYPANYSVERYARRIWEIWSQGIARLICVVAQDYMCEAHIRAKTGLSIEDHQRLTIERYDALVAELRRLFGGRPPFHVMPVLQGQRPQDYVAHLAMYGDRIAPGMWVGVGSVCKRQGDPVAIEDVLHAILRARPLMLHGFGVKLSALQSYRVRRMLRTADSMAWSFSARKQGRNANDWREAETFEARVYENPKHPEQLSLLDL